MSCFRCGASDDVLFLFSNGIACQNCGRYFIGEEIGENKVRDNIEIRFTSRINITFPLGIILLPVSMKYIVYWVPCIWRSTRYVGSGWDMDADIFSHTFEVVAKNPEVLFTIEEFNKKKNKRIELRSNITFEELEVFNE